MARIEFEAPGDWARKQEEAAAAAPAIRVHEDHPCEVCDKPAASFGFGPGGWDGMRKPRTWFCGKHKHLGEELLS